MENRKISNQDYINTGFSTCPVCGSSNVTGGSVTIDCNYAQQDAACSDCSSSWVDWYTLSSVDQVVDGAGNELDVNYD